MIFTIAAVYAVEKLGRRKLMLWGSGGLSVVYATLGMCYFFQVTGFFMIILVVGSHCILCYDSRSCHMGTPV